jgi:hypothetical protein
MTGLESSPGTRPIAILLGPEIVQKREPEEESSVAERQTKSESQTLRDTQDV